jgi:hypothetical protein
VYENDLLFTDGYMGFQAHIVNPLIIYLAWQFGYLFITGLRSML